MKTAIAKIADIGARSLFVLILMYSLPVQLAGQVGITLTLMGSFSFLIGFERYLDVQRRVVDKTQIIISTEISSSLYFYIFNCILYLPILGFLLYFWAKLPFLWALLCLIITISEQLAHECYRIALVRKEFVSLIALGMAKNFLLLFFVCFKITRNLNQIIFEEVLLAWSILSLSFLMIGYVFFKKITKQYLQKGKLLSIKEQYYRSATHFKIGLVSFLASQSEKLFAGLLLTAFESGIYFRHMYLAISIYQLLGILSYNRTLSKIYTHYQNSNFSAAKKIILKERVRYLLISILIFVVAIKSKHHLTEILPSLDSINPYFLMPLLIGFTIRGIADFEIIKLNALKLEKKIFFGMLAIVIISNLILLVLTYNYRLAGLLISSITSAIIYFLIHHQLSSKS